MLYGSESELEDSDDDEDDVTLANESRKKSAEHGVRLRLDDDEPMDLLEGAAGRIHSMFISTFTITVILKRYFRCKVKSPASAWAGSHSF